MVEETGTCSTLNLQRDVSRNICVSVKLITLHQPLTQYLTPGAALTVLQNSIKDIVSPDQQKLKVVRQKISSDKSY